MMWYARPRAQLYFTCALRPKNGRKPPKNASANYKTGPDDKTYSFCFLQYL
jgi:hypothetical protein